jgi:ribonuclease HI
MKTIVLYTDGSSRGNPGPGGYGAILLYNHHRKELAQGYRFTTNNRMELMAVIAGLEALKETGVQVKVYSDSQYVVNAVTKGWLDKWLRTNFAGGKKNPDLWMRYAALAKQFKVEFYWVKGHADNPYNNRCDELATAAADGTDLWEDEGYDPE